MVCDNCKNDYFNSVEQTKVNYFFIILLGMIIGMVTMYLILKISGAFC